MAARDKEWQRLDAQLRSALDQQWEHLVDYFRNVLELNGARFMGEMNVLYDEACGIAEDGLDARASAARAKILADDRSTDLLFALALTAFDEAKFRMADKYAPTE